MNRSFLLRASKFVTASLAGAIAVVGLSATASADICTGLYDPAYCYASPQTTEAYPDGTVTVKDNEILGNTGVQPFPGNLQDVRDELTVPPPMGLIDKELRAAQLMPKIQQVQLNHALSSSTDSSQPPCYVEYSMPCVYNLSQPIRYQEWKNSCGAASARLVAFQFTRSDPGEATFRSQLGVTRSHSNASSAGIARALNNYATPTGDKFQRSAPPSGQYYFGYVATAVWDRQHSIVQSLNTKTLPYFSGQNFDHFNVTFGYDVEGAKVHFAEEWDPTQFHRNPDGTPDEEYMRRNYPNGNPLGTHWVKTTTAWTAIKANKYAHGVIVW